MSPSDDPLALLRPRLRAVDATGSTMDDAKAWAGAGAPSGSVVWAREQRASRGRWGRAWASPRGGLWFSYVWRVRAALPAAAWGLVPHAAGVAVADALERATKLPLRLKWPNDLLVRGRKVGGLLVEASAGAERVAVVGVGVNANMPASALPEPLRAGATTLRSELGADGPLEAWLAACVASLDNGLAWLVSNRGMVLAAYRSRCETLGRRVAADLGERTVEGVARDVADDGALLVDTSAGTVRVAEGECRHLA